MKNEKELYDRLRYAGFLAGLLLSLVPAALGQTDIVKTDGITGPLHQANTGRIVFTAKSIGVENLKETDLLNSFKLKEPCDLAIKAFMANSLTNYLHRLTPDLSPDDLTAKGNFQFSFLVDGVLIHKENLSPAWIPAENKNRKTVYEATFLNSSAPDAQCTPGRTQVSFVRHPRSCRSDD